MTPQGRFAAIAVIRFSSSNAYYQPRADISLVIYDHLARMHLSVEFGSFLSLSEVRYPICGLDVLLKARVRTAQVHDRPALRQPATGPESQMWDVQ